MQKVRHPGIDLSRVFKINPALPIIPIKEKRLPPKTPVLWDDIIVAAGGNFSRSGPAGERGSLSALEATVTWSTRECESAKKTVYLRRSGLPLEYPPGYGPKTLGLPAPSRPAYLDGLLRPWAMTAAVIKKEWLLHVRYPGMLLALLIWPVLLPLAYIFSGQALAGPRGEGVGSFAALAGTTDFRSYIILGTTLWMWINLTLWGLGTWLRQEQMRGTLEANWLTPAPRLWLLFSTILWSALGDLFFLIVSLAEFRLLLGFHISGSLWLFLIALLAALPSIYGLGLLFAALVVWAKETNSLVFVVRGVFLVFAGITYPVAAMPAWMQLVSQALPLTYSLHALRAAALTPAGWETIAGDVYITLLFGVILLGLGMASFCRTDRQARRLGTVGTY
ncbi:MAG: ABC transporter permease [Firmicutes bacterium]|nr:ABC transporter permease [Bacillota bacterium]MCL5040212.1 ABC transporter permease [Bacillota bacterium]